MPVPPELWGRKIGDAVEKTPSLEFFPPEDRSLSEKGFAVSIRKGADGSSFGYLTLKVR